MDEPFTQILSMEPGSIIWMDAVSPGAAQCPVCESRDPKRVVLEMPNAAPGEPLIRLLACPGCGANFWDHVPRFAYETATDHTWPTDFYVEQGAALDALIEPIANLPTERIKRCLEIGCGFGFSLDAARRLFGWTVIGVDPSPLARAGRKALDLDIRSIYADRDTDLGGAFDLVYGAEIIEHVASPPDILQVCRAHLAPDGILVLTTPDAASIRPDTSISILLPILSPGHHLVLFTAESLALIARRAGFREVRVVRREHNLVLYASDQPLEVEEGRSLDRALYRSYLTSALARPDLTRSLAIGLRYRLLKEFVHSAEYAAALTLYLRIAADCEALYGFEPKPPLPEFLEERVMGGARRGHFGAPFCLAGLLFYRGMISFGAAPPGTDAVEWFDSAAAAARLFRVALGELGLDDGETGMIERNAAELALLALCHRDPASAIARLRTLPRIDSDLSSALVFRLLDLGAIVQAGEAARLSGDQALMALAEGWRLLLAGKRDSEACDAFAVAARGGGQITLRAHAGKALALASIDPGRAAQLGRELAAQGPPLDSLVLRLIDLGALDEARQVVGSEADSPLAILVEGWRQLIEGQDVRAHEAFARVADSADGAVAERARAGDAIAQASIDPDATVALAHEMSGDAMLVEQALIKLVDLGHLTQAAAVIPLVVDAHSWKVARCQAMLALLHKEQPKVAAELFAAAFAMAAAHNGPVEDIWWLKYHELFAWIGAGDAEDAGRVLREIEVRGDIVPEKVRAAVQTLLVDHPSVRESALQPVAP